MATRDHRLREFDQGPPPSDQALQVLCEDHSGTYLLPYACHWNAGAFFNSALGSVIDAKVVGWRVAMQRDRT